MALSRLGLTLPSTGSGALSSAGGGGTGETVAAGRVAALGRVSGASGPDALAATLGGTLAAVVAGPDTSPEPATYQISAPTSTRPMPAPAPMMAREPTLAAPRSDSAP